MEVSSHWHRQRAESRARARATKIETPLNLVEAFRLPFEAEKYKKEKGAMTTK